MGSAISNLLAALEILGQLGGIVQSAPVLGPIGAILKVFVEAYKVRMIHPCVSEVPIFFTIESEGRGWEKGRTG